MLTECAYPVARMGITPVGATGVGRARDSYHLIFAFHLGGSTENGVGFC